MKKLSLLIISAITIFSLSACGSSQEDIVEATQKFKETSMFASTNRVSSDTASDSYTSGFGNSYDTGSIQVTSTYNSSNVKGFNSEESQDYDEEDYNDEEYTEQLEENNTNSEQQVDLEDNKNNQELAEEKLVYTCTLNIETLDYDKATEELDKIIDKYNALISSENEKDNNDTWYIKSETNYRNNKTRQNYIQLRVPSDKYKEFVSETCTVGKLRNKEQNVENITSKYYDTKTEIESLRTQESRLLEMYNSCNTIEDMITVEKRLTEVQSQLSKLQSDLNYMDIDVAYSYINIYLVEVVEYTPESEPVKQLTFLDRLKNTLLRTKDNTLDFLEDLLFAIIEISPVLIVILVIVIIFRKKIKSAIKRIKDNRKAEKELEESLKVITDSLNEEDKTEETK